MEINPVSCLGAYYYSSFKNKEKTFSRLFESRISKQLPQYQNEVLLEFKPYATLRTRRKRHFLTQHESLLSSGTWMTQRWLSGWTQLWVSQGWHLWSRLLCLEKKTNKENKSSKCSFSNLSVLRFQRAVEIWIHWLWGTKYFEEFTKIQDLMNC